MNGKPCPNGPHRGPEGPNEDLAQCPVCWFVSYTLRPEGETYGEHLPDCSLPLRHESYCQPGGAGHPTAPKIRGYWPEVEVAERAQVDDAVALLTTAADRLDLMHCEGSPIPWLPELVAMLLAAAQQAVEVGADRHAVALARQIMGEEGR